MALKDDLVNKIRTSNKEKYTIEDTKGVPDVGDTRLTYGNTGLVGDYSFLFVDIRGSSELVATYKFEKTAKILQAFHDINVRVIISNKGEIRSFDGDRVMGVFSGDLRKVNAVKAAMQILHAIRSILNPELNANIICGAGIDDGKALITKVGKGANVNNNDVVWVGRAANYASHLCNEAANCVIISPTVYNDLTDKYKLLNEKGVNMWTSSSVVTKNNKSVPVFTTHRGWLI